MFVGAWFVRLHVIQRVPEAGTVLPYVYVPLLRQTGAVSMSRPVPTTSACAIVSPVFMSFMFTCDRIAFCTVLCCMIHVDRFAPSLQALTPKVMMPIIASINVMTSVISISVKPCRPRNGTNEFVGVCTPGRYLYM